MTDFLICVSSAARDRLWCCLLYTSLVEVDHAELVVSSGGDELALGVVVVRHLNELEGELARLDGAALEVLDDLRIDVAHLIDRLAASSVHAIDVYKRQV